MLKKKIFMGFCIEPEIHVGVDLITTWLEHVQLLPLPAKPKA
jgi:hypothetical protein